MGAQGGEKHEGGKGQVKIKNGHVKKRGVKEK